jgi:hypothetical protein
MIADWMTKQRSRTRSGLLADFSTAEQIREGVSRYLDQHGWDVTDDEASWRAYQRRRMAEDYTGDNW